MPNRHRMDWIRSGLDSLTGWLAPPPVRVAGSVEQVDAIRNAMLAALGEAGAAQRPGLATRIRFCRHADTLWDLRGELMDISSLQHGEAHARRMLETVSRLFDGLSLQNAGGERDRSANSADDGCPHP